MISLHVLSEHADVQSEALELHWPAHPHRCHCFVCNSLTWSIVGVLRWVRWVKDDFFACIIWTCWCAIRSSRITLTGSPAPLCCCLCYSLTWSIVEVLRWVRWVKDDFFACIIWTCWCAIRSSRITLTGSPAPLSLLSLLQLDLKHVRCLALGPLGQGWFLCMYYLNMLMCNQKL